MERKQRPKENEPPFIDPFLYWLSPLSTMFARICGHLSTLRELWHPDSQSERIGKDGEIYTGNMHRALEVPEILNLVFKSGLSDRDLVRCALVCRLWETWALDLLWGTRPASLRNVIRILTLATKKTGSFNIRPYAYWEIGRIDQHSWRRFLAISNKITTIDIDIGVGDITFERIKRATQSFDGLGAPFSHLRTLRIKSNGWDLKFMNALSLATVPSLTRIFVDSQYPKQDIMDWVCNDVPARAPNITHLVLERVSEVNAEASRYAALKYLQIQGEFRSRLWESLSCPVLEKIVVIWCMNIRSVFRLEDLDSLWLVDYVYFPALRTLKIRLGYHNIAVALILRSRMPMLERLYWDAPLYGDCRDHVVAHLRAHSTRLNLDMLHLERSSNEWIDNWEGDSDDGCCWP